MKLVRVLFMLIAVSVFSTSIGATIPDWRKSSKNVVDGVRQPEKAVSLELPISTKKVVLVLGYGLDASCQGSDVVTTLISTRVEQLKIYSMDVHLFNYVSMPEPISITADSYYVPKNENVANVYFMYRMPRDGIRC